MISLWKKGAKLMINVREKSFDVYLFLIIRMLSMRDTVAKFSKNSRQSIYIISRD